MRPFVVATASMAVFTAQPTSIPLSENGLARCEYELRPTSPLHEDASLQTEFNFVTTRSFSLAVDGAEIHASGYGASFSGPNPNGTYSVRTELGASGMTSLDVKSIIQSLEGQLRQGYATDWIFEKVACTA
ncbi:hypothetical protein CPC08DRAFT_762587 [Agrocybe pediades]|nr:hypothetical protein CPC08DRAFT_762587 [Agrocybe pediades]